MQEKIKDSTGKEKVLFDINLTLDQYSYLFNNSQNKTYKQWINGLDDVKVDLTSTQKYDIITKKNKILLNRDSLTFTDHAIERIAERIEGNKYKEPDESTYDLVYDELKNSKELADEARWKGRTNFTYAFICEFHKKKSKVVISFNGDKNIATVTIIKNVK